MFNKKDGGIQFSAAADDEQVIDNKKPLPEIKTWTFVLLPRDQEKSIPVGAFPYLTEEQALGKARRECAALTLPGWRLACVETGNVFPAVAFVDASPTAENKKVFL